MTKSCPKGQYYCYTDKKCKKIPKGYAIGARGYLRQEPQDDDSKKNGNGKSNGHSKSNGGHGNGGGNGNGGNGSGGNGGGVSEATMTPSQKRKDTMLKKKYDDSGMMKSMKKQYGKEEGKKVYYATIRKQAMETKYYDGSDRNPNTGLPKGIKGGETKTKDKILNRVPHEILRAHTEIPVTDIQVSNLDELTDYKSFAAKAQEIRDKRRQRKEDQKQKDKEYMAKKRERAEKGIRFYDTKGKGYMKGGVKTYDEARTFPDGFLKKYPNLDPNNPRDYKRLKQLLNYPQKKAMVDVNPDVQIEGSLHQWFKGSKSKDGKPGWVNVKTGGTCASDEPGEGTPKCVSSAKRASMSKAERESASRRKKAADPGQQSKTGAAKPTYVSTDKPKKKKMTEEKKNKNVKGIAKELDKAVAMHKSQAKRLRKAGVSEENVVEAKDKKGKGSGSKDACYHKVKSRYSVWPSAYASGALVKCRKVGAANWGNSKKEEFEGNISYTAFMEKCWKGYEKKGMKTMFGKRYPNCVKKEDVQLEDSRLTSSNSMQSKMYADKNKSGKKMSDDEIKKEKGGKDFLARIKAAKAKMKKEDVQVDEKVNLKDKSSQYARSTKEVDTAMTDHVNRTRGKTYNLKTGKVTDDGRYRRPSKREARNELISLNKESLEHISIPLKKIDTDLQNRKRVQEFQKRFKSSDRKLADEFEPQGKSFGQFRQECWKTHKKVGMKMKGGKLVNDCRPKNEEVVNEIAKKHPRIEENPYSVKNKVKMVGSSIKDRVKQKVKSMTRKEEVETIDEKKSPAWQRKEGKNPSGGLNAKGVASYRAANPGSKLKTAVTTKPSKLKKGSKAANRRKSFCARMKGMKKRLTSAKTARDPDSRINKSLRKWNC